MYPNYFLVCENDSSEKCWNEAGESLCVLHGKAESVLMFNNRALPVPLSWELCGLLKWEPGEDG